MVEIFRCLEETGLRLATLLLPVEMSFIWLPGRLEELGRRNFFSFMLLPSPSTSSPAQTDRQVFGSKSDDNIF